MTPAEFNAIPHGRRLPAEAREYLAAAAKSWRGYAAALADDPARAAAYHTMVDFCGLLMAGKCPDAVEAWAEGRLRMFHKSVQYRRAGFPDRGNNATIYRATTNGYTGPGSCWSPDLETAEAYQVEGLGYRGRSIVTAELTGSVLDVQGGRGVDFEALAEALGYDPDTAQEWADNGWLYPWEESREVARRLTASDYSWITYLDDYPELATTYRRIK